MWQLGCIYGFGRLAWVAALHRGWERVGRETDCIDGEREKKVIG